MTKKKIQVSDIENGQINVVGNNRIKNLPASIPLPESSKDNLELEISRLKDTVVNLTGNDDISYARSDIQEGLSTLEKILLPILDKNQAEQAQEAIVGAREESQKKLPDFEKIKKHLTTLLKIVSMLHVSPETIEAIKAFILSVGAKFGFGI